MPSNFDDTKKTFVLYNSSDDEFAAVGKQFENPYFKDQLEGIMYIVEYFKKTENYQLIIRMHPNLKGLKRDYLDPLYEMENRYSNIILIKPQDDIDTYELMEKADTVIAFGSTIGMEASFWGKPVISLGRSFYFYTGLTYTPKDRENIIHLLESDLQPLDKLPAQKNAYYLMTGGHKAKYYFKDENKQVYFKNINLNKLPSWFKIYYKTLKFFSVKN